MWVTSLIFSQGRVLSFTFLVVKRFRGSCHISTWGCDGRGAIRSSNLLDLSWVQIEKHTPMQRGYARPSERRLIQQ